MTTQPCEVVHPVVQILSQEGDTLTVECLVCGTVYLDKE